MRLSFFALPKNRGGDRCPFASTHSAKKLVPACQALTCKTTSSQTPLFFLTRGDDLTLLKIHSISTSNST